MFDSESFFNTRLGELRQEGRYRQFADLERRAGAFPRAYHHMVRSAITVWCSNDYLGMGQHPEVLAAMHEAIDQAGAGAGAGGTDCERFLAAKRSSISWKGSTECQAQVNLLQHCFHSKRAAVRPTWLVRPSRQ